MSDLPVSSWAFCRLPRGRSAGRCGGILPPAAVRCCITCNKRRPA